MTKLTTNPRLAYGETLAELAAENRNIVVLDADLCKSTMSVLVQDQFPERFIEMGIAEQNMASMAAGLALAGKIPFINSFAVFVVGRAYDQIRQAISVPKLNVRIIGSSAGLSDFGDGATHQSVEDIALMRALPNMTVICPCDALEVRNAVRAIIDYQGPVYLRLSRSEMPVVTAEGDLFTIGRLSRLTEGDDVAIMATGCMVTAALEAERALRPKGITSRVINVSTLKPLDPAAVLSEVKGVKAIVTAEEHSVIGGLGSAILEALRFKPLPVEFVGIQDCFGVSGTDHAQLMEHYGLTSAAIVKAVERILSCPP